MKSRSKLGLFGTRREKRREAQPQRKSVLRRGLLETLEKRELLAGDVVSSFSDGLYYPAIGLRTGDFVKGMDYETYAARNAATSSSSSSSSGSGSQSGLLGEGDGDAFTGSSASVTELEPNNGRSNATFIPFGTASGKTPIVNISGNIIPPTFLNPLIGFKFDEDYFSMDLRGGDIVDAKLTATAGVVFDVTLLDSRGNEIAGRRDPVSPIGPLGSVYTPASPLSIDGNVSFAYTIPTSGRYYFRVADGIGAYTLTAKAYRPTLEKADIGTGQIVFVDFDGARVNTDTFGLPLGTVRLSPLTTYFAQAGLQPQDEEAFVREFMAVLNENFHGSLPSLAANGHRPTDGVPGHFDLRFINSFDNPDFDPIGIPNVTQLIIAGDGTQFPLPVRGISNSVDIGNFETAGITLVLPDVYMNPTSGDFVGAVPRAANVTLLTAIAQAMGNTASHELGHSFGAWHQENSNATLTLMDSGGLPIGPSRMGVGPDGIFGTADDIDIDFGKDYYTTAEGNIGLQDTASLMAWALSTGTAGGGFVTGVTFNDRNKSRSLDSADARLPSVLVYADANNDRTFNDGEMFTVSDSNGDYRLLVPAGNHTIRQRTPAGYAVSTPSDNSHVVSITVGGTAANRHFGSELVDQSITGMKWSDTNGNALRDAGEPGIGGVWIYIDLDGDNRIDLGEPATQSAADGTYKLTFPGAGTFQIREVVPPGFVQTFPNVSEDGDPLNDYEHQVVLTGDPSTDSQRISNLNFGNRMTVDFGDAPQSYGVASHGFLNGLRLGQLWDAEQSSRFSADATGDDSNGRSGSDGTVQNDEDGVVLTRPLVRGSSNNRASVTAINSTGSTAYVNAWIDYNQDGDFNDAGEQVATNFAVPDGAALPATVQFAAPGGAKLGNTFARIRLSAAPNVGPTGSVAAGEVEDYLVTVVDTLELAVNDNFTVARNATQQTLDVLANDFRLPGETVSIAGRSESTSAGGLLQTSADKQFILYTPPAQFVGQDIFTYTYQNSGGETDEATVVVDVRLVFDDPQAIDDSFNLPTNALDLPLNVLANDIEGPGGALSIVSVTQPDKGGQITIATGGKSLRYTPARGFGGTEFLTYTVGDGNGEQSTAQVTLHTLPGDQADDDVRIRLVVTDLAGAPISAVQQGDSFKVKVEVDDLRFDSSNPGTSAGVFAAYFDLLYNMQLVSPAAGPEGSQFNFDVDFAEPYVAVRRGNAAVPGIINEFGAVSNLTLMDHPDPLTMADIVFTAGSPGIASFMPDPAEDVPNSDTLLFDVPGSAVPKERIRFVGASLEIVGDGVRFPVAIDDSVPDNIAPNASFAIDVLANDLRGSSGQISIIDSTDGAHGTTRIDTRGSSNPANHRVVYTPFNGFNGADQFTYTIADSRGIQSTATVTLRVGQVADQIVDYRLSVTDLSGAPIEQITVGDKFQLRGYVKDLRTSGQDLGIFAAYQDVLYSSSLVSPVASTTNDPDLGFQVTFGPSYNRIREGDIRNAGIINEIGAVSTLDQPLGTDEYLLFTVTMTANSVGQASFISDPADISPLHDTLTYNPVLPVSFDEIRFGSDTLNIVNSTGGSGGGEGFTNWNNRMDVNADGFVSPIDVLGIINTLNALGSGRLSTGGGEGEGKLYVDTSADGMLSPIDVLLVINYLNQSRATGEGEAAAAALGFAAPSVDSPLPEEVGNAVDVSPLAVADLAPSVGGKIGGRETSQFQGPALHAFATDSLFGEEDDDFESMLGELAPEIEETWKRNLLS